MANEDEAERGNSTIPLQDLADAIAGRGEGDVSRQSETEGQTPGGGEGSKERSGRRFDAPLEELATAVANRRASRSRSVGSDSPEEDQLTDLARKSDTKASGVTSRATRAVGRVIGQGSAGPREDASPFMYTVHYLVTGGALLGSATINIAASIGMIPAQWWLLALPMMMLGIIGALPVLSRWLGIWEPQELR